MDQQTKIAWKVAFGCFSWDSPFAFPAMIVPPTKATIK
jgi:hypothetical protein